MRKGSIRNEERKSRNSFVPGDERDLLREEGGYRSKAVGKGATGPEREIPTKGVGRDDGFK